MMKRRIPALLLVLVLLSCFTVCAFAGEAQESLDYVTDRAGVLTEDQLSELEARAKSISEQYDFGVYVVTVPDFKSIHSSGAWEAGKRVFQQYGLGKGAENAGVMIFLSMEDRDYAIVCNGSRADYAFTERGRDRLEDSVVPYFKVNNYYGGFREFLNTCDTYLNTADAGEPYGTVEEESSGIGFFAAIPGAIVAALTGTVMSSSMHSAGVKRNADAYVVTGSMELRRRSDMFMRRTVVRTPRQTQSNNSPSHNSTHHSSGSFSGRSGKF